MLTSGQLLADRYRLARRIAVGGMGEVWEAADTRLDRRVAVKVLKPELGGDAEFLHRFRTEARTTASLNHPGIAAVHDYGETAAIPDGPQDTAYLVMELVEGEPLAGILAKEHRISAERTLDILEQAGRALQAAHERGYVHRDVKPGNILITPTGVVKLTDFGIAKAADAAPVTRSGMVMGTAHYIAPEQALGHDAEPASDVYSLAVVGYECLTGHRPFLSENAVTVAMMHIRDMPPPLPPDVPFGTRAVIEATLVKDPRQRYGSGAEFAAAVAAVRAGHPLPAPSGMAYAHLVASPSSTQPGILPPIVVPQQLGPGTGTFGGPVGPPPPPQHGSRAWMWVLLAAIAALAIVLIVWVAMLLTDNDGGSGRDENGGEPSPRTSTEQQQQPGSTPGDGGRPGNEETTTPINPTMPSNTNPGTTDTAVIRLKDLRDHSAQDVQTSLAGLGFRDIVIVDESGTQSGEDRCMVTDVTPNGTVALDEPITIKCSPFGG